MRPIRCPALRRYPAAVTIRTGLTAVFALLACRSQESTGQGSGPPLRPRSDLVFAEAPAPAVESAPPGHAPAAVPEDPGDCPPSTRHVGGKPPAHHEEYCLDLSEAGRPKRMGPYRKWTPDGTLVSEGAFLDDKPHGNWREYQPGGTLKSETTYDQGVVHGPWVTYFETGRRSGEGSYEHGKKTGRGTFWYENGNMKADGNYVDDLREGSSRNWYPSGSLESEGAYRAGKKEGPWTEYDEKGQASAFVYEAGVRRP